MNAFEKAYELYKKQNQEKVATMLTKLEGKENEYLTRNRMIRELRYNIASFMVINSIYMEVASIGGLDFIKLHHPIKEKILTIYSSVDGYSIEGNLYSMETAHNVILKFIF